MSTGADPLTFCCLLWAQPGAADGLHAYEDGVLELFADHGAVVLERAIGDGADGQPVEVQILSFPHQAALDGYIADPRRTTRLGERDRVDRTHRVLPGAPAAVEVTSGSVES